MILDGVPARHILQSCNQNNIRLCAEFWDVSMHLYTQVSPHAQSGCSYIGIYHTYMYGIYQGASQLRTKTDFFLGHTEGLSGASHAVTA